MTCSPPPKFATVIHHQAALDSRLDSLEQFVLAARDSVPLSAHPAWTQILHRALGHQPYVIEANGPDGRTVGYLPLVYLHSFLWGKFLVSLPYLNSSGVLANHPTIQADLIARASELAHELNVRYLELRHETAVHHPALNATMTRKVHMRLPLPATTEKLWKSFDPKVRNQVRKGEKNGFVVEWGGAELLPAFHDILCHNMRDLGSPFYGIGLFREILAAFPGRAEICLLCDKQQPAAAALLFHGWGVTEVPSASSLKEYNPTNANMLMYWELLKRAIDRRQKMFDFGRSTVDGPTYRFKKQWGAEPQPAVWQYHVLRGEVGEMRPDNPKYQRAIRIWKRLPVAVTRRLGPVIIRGIP
ncbi:MAG TPA: FemAB family XrtA/PEP-CTERM system-associated protein [Gemmata sp.]|nr:FemAB family XrtA/PEP-CTERM system-associated protein [Gemmata sp.]